MRGVCRNKPAVNLISVRFFRVINFIILSGHLIINEGKVCRVSVSLLCVLRRVQKTAGAHEARIGRQLGCAAVLCHNNRKAKNKMK